MATFIIYIIRWAVCLTLLYSLFGLFMKRVQLYEASAESRRWMDGTGVLTIPIDIDELRPHAHSVVKQQSKPRKQGRIIR